MRAGRGGYRRLDPEVKASVLPDAVALPRNMVSVRIAHCKDMTSVIGIG